MISPPLAERAFAPPELTALVDACVSTQPDGRPADGGEIASALEAVQRAR